MDKFVKMSEEDFINEAVSIISKAKEKGIVLRILGALGVFMHTEESSIRNLFYSLERLGKDKPLFTDLDLAGYSKQTPAVKKFFEQELGFKPNIYINTLFAYRRNIFDHPENLFSVDVFYDRLEFSHSVEFGNAPGRGRLEVDFPTISLANIVLEKLQIHRINRKDLIDLIILFLGHPVKKGENSQAIDSSYIAKTLANDWGFWYDACENMKKVKSITSEFHADGKLDSAQVEKIEATLDLLLKQIEDEPKTRNWQNRARKGTSIPWYKDVEEVER